MTIKGRFFTGIVLTGIAIFDAAIVAMHASLIVMLTLSCSFCSRFCSHFPARSVLASVRFWFETMMTSLYRAIVITFVLLLFGSAIPYFPYFHIPFCFILRLEGFLLVEIAKKYKMFSVWFLVFLQGS